MSRQDRAKSGSNFFEKWMTGGKKKPPGRGQSGQTTRPLSETDFSYGDPDAAAGPASDSYRNTIELMNDKELMRAFDKLLDDMNLTDAKRQPLRDMPPDQKKTILLAHHNANQDQRSKFDQPQQYIDYLKNCLSDQSISATKLGNCVESLRIALTNNTLTWVNGFGDRGMQTLFEILLKATTQNREPKYERIQTECLKCLIKYINNTEGLRSFLQNKKWPQHVTKCIDFNKPQVSIVALQIMAALCCIRDDPHIGSETALMAVTEVADFKNQERFTIITECITRTTNEDLWSNALKFINALLSNTDDFELRVHLRNEIVRNGLYEMLDIVKQSQSIIVSTQYEHFTTYKEEDAEELNHRFGDVRIEIDDVTDLFEIIKNLTLNTTSETYLLSIFQHLLFIRDDLQVRNSYFKLIEEVISQIVLQKNGLDPDFTKKPLHIDVQNLLDEIKENSLDTEVSEGKFVELQRQLEEALAAKEEALAKLAIMEGKSSGGDGGSNSKPGGLTALVGILNSGGVNVGSVGPPPPPMPGLGGLGGVVSGGPPPPPMPGVIGAPPPPPFPGAGGGPPPPPPPPGLGPGPPGPPPPPMMGGGPPPPPFGAAPIALVGMAGPQLPAGLKPKKKWDTNGPLKKANWKSIIPHKLTEKSFWFKVKEEELASNDILDGLAQRFTSKPLAKKVDDIDKSAHVGTMKKTKALKVLDGKTAQNISILLSGSLKHMPYDDIKNCLLRCDEKVLSENVLEQLIQYLPPADQLQQFKQYKDKYEELTEAEQFCVKMAEIKRLLPRLKSLSFRQNYAEIINDIKPEIVAATAACQEVKRSKKFATILELILLLGNYMNTGSRNAQAFGFEISFLTKLSGTKDIENKQTLLHYIVETVEKKFPEVLHFMDEMPHIDSASRVSFDTIQKSLSQMDKEIKNLENDLKNNRIPQCEEDKFTDVMDKFAREAREQCAVLQNMFKKMENLYGELAEFYVFDKNKYALEEFFSDLKVFKDSFQEAKRDNDKEREIVEKNQRAKEARRKADAEKQEREARKKALIDMNPSETQEGVMDSLLEALQTGTAFSREQRRQRAPRLAGADRRAQLIRSRSRSNVLQGTGRELREITAS